MTTAQVTKLAITYLKLWMIIPGLLLLALIITQAMASDHAVAAYEACLHAQPVGECQAVLGQ